MAVHHTCTDTFGAKEGLRWRQLLASNCAKCLHVGTHVYLAQNWWSASMWVLRKILICTYVIYRFETTSWQGSGVRWYIQIPNKAEYLVNWSWSWLGADLDGRGHNSLVYWKLHTYMYTVLTYTQYLHICIHVLSIHLFVSIAIKCILETQDYLNPYCHCIY